jgi:hypothetical protein
MRARNRKIMIRQLPYILLASALTWLINLFTNNVHLTGQRFRNGHRDVHGARGGRGRGDRHDDHRDDHHDVRSG